MELNSYGTELMSLLFIAGCFLATTALAVLPSLLDRRERKELLKAVPFGVFMAFLFAVTALSFVGYRIPASTVTRGVVVEKRIGYETQRRHIVSIKGKAKNGRMYTVQCRVREKDFDRIRIGDVYDKANIVVEKRISY